jgi:hypothetical protein
LRYLRYAARLLSSSITLIKKHLLGGADGWKQRRVM